MTHNFKVKVITGKKTQLEVHVISTAVNEKKVDFNNSRKHITNKQLSKEMCVAIFQFIQQCKSKP